MPDNIIRFPPATSIPTAPSRGPLPSIPGEFEVLRVAALLARCNGRSLDADSTARAISASVVRRRQIAERIVGLDLVVEGCAKPGHETEWRRLLERSFADSQLSEAESARFSDISAPGYGRVGAPRVGTDAAADAWIIEARVIGL